MSNYFDLGCRTCNVRAGVFHWNHGAVQIRNLLPHLPAIVAFDAVVRDTCLSVNVVGESFDWDALVAFAKEHVGHDIRPRSEYGEFDGECGSRGTCPHCGHGVSCKRDAGHTGEHSP